MGWYNLNRKKKNQNLKSLIGLIIIFRVKCTNLSSTPFHKFEGGLVLGYHVRIIFGERTKLWCIWNVYEKSEKNNKNTQMMGTIW